MNFLRTKIVKYLNSLFKVIYLIIKKSVIPINIKFILNLYLMATVHGTEVFVLSSLPYV